MSKSVEEQIREVLEDVAIEYGEYPSPETINVDQATDKILSIIETDVIEEDEDIMVIPLPDGGSRSAKYDTAHQHFTAGKNTLRQAQRNKLRSNPNE